MNTTRAMSPATSSAQSGGERAAVQTLRVVFRRLANAQRLECGGFSTALERGSDFQLPRNFRRALKASAFLFLCLGFLFQAQAADNYTGTCNVVFEGDSTLHAFTGDITNIALVVLCETNSAGIVVINTRMEIAPKQLSTHHAKRDKNMYAMFQPDKFPKLLAVVTNAPLAAAKLTPTEAAGTNGLLPVQLTFCGITKEVAARTTNPKAHADGWEFDLQTDVSLKAFKLEPPSVMFGAISVADKVVIKAHVQVKKDAAK